MYIRSVDTKAKTGATYTKYQLVESYRTENGPRQRIILTLTDLDLEKPLWPALARVISDRLSGVESIFDEDPKIAHYADMVMTKLNVKSEIIASDSRRDSEADFERVDLNTAATTKVRSLGPELIGERFYDLLGCEEILANAGLPVKALPIAKAVILARLIHPGSDLATYRWIRDNSSLVELAGIEIAKFTKDQVYEVADALYGVKDEIERALFRSSSTLFPTDETLFLFDLTNTYFEGNAKANTLAKYGHSKEKRYDCALVSLALVVDARGLPIYSEIYEGSVSEPRTLADVLAHLEELRGETLFAGVTPTIIMDRGIATADNVSLCIEKELNYVVIERANKASLYKEHFRSLEGFVEVTDANGSAVGLKKLQEGQTSVVLCSSVGRKNKETGIASQASTRFLADIERLRRSIARGAVVKTQLVSERIGRIKAKYPSVAGNYDFSLSYHEDHGKVIKRSRVDRVIDLTITERPTKTGNDYLRGAYVIETNHNELTEGEIWNLYMTLTRVENAFRSLKSDLGLRPVYHQLATRTAAHLFISVLGYHLLSAIELTLRSNDDTRSWSTIKEQVSTHARTTMVLTSDEGIVNHIRVSSVPEPTQRKIYSLLGVRDPLKRTKTIATRL